MGVSYLITTPLSRASTGARRYCFVFRETLEPNPNRLTMRSGKSSSSSRYSSSNDDSSSMSQSSLDGSSISVNGGGALEDSEPEFKRILHFSSIADSCRRNVAPGIEGALAFNVTTYGKSGRYKNILSSLYKEL
jgi:hypothetical protein